jgi:hypothetical protein
MIPFTFAIVAFNSFTVLPKFAFFIESDICAKSPETLLRLIPPLFVFYFHLE